MAASENKQAEAAAPQPGRVATDELAAELRYIKGHATYRLGQRLRASGLWNALRWLQNRNRRVVRVRVPAAGARGPEVWLLAAYPNASEDAVPWDFVECRGGWQERGDPAQPYGRCLVTGAGGTLRVPVDRDPELRFRAHAAGGEIVVAFRGRRERIDLRSPEPGEVRVFPARTPMALRPAPMLSGAPAQPASPPNDKKTVARAVRSTADEAFLQQVAAMHPRAVAVHCPRWLGVTHSTRRLFACTYPVPETPDEEPYQIDETRLACHADVLAESGVEHVVFSGGDEVHFRLMRRLRQRRPGVRCDLLWHGGYLFFNKDYDWHVLKLWMDAARAGEVTTLGTVKKGMEEFFTQVGLRSRLILNYVPGTPQAPPALEDAAWRVGLWMSDTIWKVPHAMLAALAMVPHARLHAAGLAPRAEEVARYFGVPIEVFHRGRLTPEELQAEIRRTHLTLYVTFTECCPMLPLESIHLGVPSLVGPVSHLFEDNQFLFERLVVPFPERAEVIARYARRALEERAEIMAACTRYIPDYNAAALRSVEAFLA